MSNLDEIRNARIKKREELMKKGLYPYPENTERDITLKEAIDNFDSILRSGEKKVIAGRVLSIRGQGGLSFLSLNDGTSSFQAVIQKGDIEDDEMDLFSSMVDIGDIIEVGGEFFLTKRGTQSIKIREWKMLSKSIRPLPEKWHGLKDTEERYRRRYLDMISNPELKDLFVKKALFWKVVREFLEEKGFLEVHTPTLELTTGGAEAEPFRTHHNDFDVDLYLRISVGELWQKRLMAAGFTRTYEIGRVYRNEGSSPEHLQEFTNMEFYAAYMNFDKGKEMIKELYRDIANKVFGTTKFKTHGYEFDLSSEWKEYDYVKTILEMTEVNVLKASKEELEVKLKELGVKYDGGTKERMTDSLWKYCRKQIAGPAFLINHPKLIAPLSKTNEKDDRLTRTLQVIIAGSEIGRAHAELNDPIDQKERFKDQEELMKSGDNEAMMPDWDFVEMLEHGMPPTFGFGFGERLFSFLADKTIREATLFPLMKPEGNQKKEE